MSTATRREFKEVTRQRPCPICGKDSWCSASDDGERIACRRSHDSTQDSSFEFAGERQDKGGATFFSWRLKGTGGKSPGVNYHHTEGNGQPADPDVLHSVYKTFLGQLSYAVAFGDERGIPSGEVIKRGYRILDQKRTRGVREVINVGFEKHLPNVPGFMVKEKDGKQYWSLSGKGGIVIPIRDPEGQIIACKVRRDDADAKYKYLTSSGVKWLRSDDTNGQGPSPGSPLHFPLFDGDRSSIRLTEGEFKADVATFKSGLWTIGLPGVNQWRQGVRAVQELGSKSVSVAFDTDFRKNKNVRDSLINLLRGLLEIEGLEVILERWPEDAGKGIDDVFIAGKAELIERVSGEELSGFVSELSTSTEPQEDENDKRPIVIITTNEDEVNQQVISHLANDPNIFQRRGTLVHIIRDVNAREQNGTRSPADTPRIATLPQAKLRSRMTANIRFKTLKVTDEGEVLTNAHPQDWTVRGVADYGEYPGIKTLEGVIESPALRPDGSILSEPGYDPQTRLVLDSRIPFPNISANPTRQEAQEAAQKLLDIVVDFPFASPIHRAAWLAAMITPMARIAFSGPAPMFMIEANAPGVGKTLNTNTISIVYTGRPMFASDYTHRNEEMEKKITTIALSGQRLCLIDNINGHFGGHSSMDAALTSTQWQGRMLGFSKDVTAPLHVTWFGTGNNVEIVGDTVRRVLPIRLETMEENPEDRQGFKHNDLIQYVTDNRAEFLAAILTILRAFFVAGCPQANIPSWGSYEGWSKIVRQALVWIGQPDPYGARLEIRSQANTDVNALAQLIEAIEEVDPHHAGVYASEMIKVSAESESMRLAIMEICPTRNGLLPTPRSLGNVIRRFAKRVVGGKYLIAGTKQNQGIPWVVKTADQTSDSRASGDSPRGATQAGNTSKHDCDAITPMPQREWCLRESQAPPESLTPPATPLHYNRTFGDSVESPESGQLKIGPPSANLLVRGPGLFPDYVRASSIPAEADEYKDGSEWWPIPDHWRGGAK